MRLQAKVMMVMLILSILLMAPVFLFVVDSKKKSVEEAGRVAAKALNETVSILRGVYTTNVVQTGQKMTDDAGKPIVRFNYDFDRAPRTFPLPATMVKLLGEKVSRDLRGTRIKLYSDLPFPHRIGTVDAKQDDFEIAALKAVTEKPAAPFFKLDAASNTMRYVTADLLVAPGCVNCHNNHPESPTNPKNPNSDPKNHREWKLNEVRGALEVTVPLEDVDKALKQGQVKVVGVFLGGLVFIIAGMLLFMQGQLVSPLLNLSNIGRNISAGDLRATETAATLANRGDEIGIVAGALSEMASKIRTTFAEMKEATDNVLRAANEVAKEHPGARKIQRHAEMLRDTLSRYQM